MARPPLPAEVLTFLAAPNPAVMATLRKDGAPVSVATWYLLDGDRILLNLDAGRTRLGHLRRDPRVSLTVTAARDWYTHVSVQGRTDDIEDDAGLAGIDRLSQHYTGHAYPNRNRPRVNAWMTIERWHGWGKAAAWR